MEQDLADALNWRSLHWHDGCKYEGLEAGGACESHGVVSWPHLRERYEGQLRGSQPHGHGAYRWGDGTLYRGEWYDGHMHGCGVMIWKDAAGAIQAKAGKFFSDDFVGPVLGCSADEAHEAALEADVAAGRARTFETSLTRRPLGASDPAAANTGARGAGSPSAGWLGPPERQAALPAGVCCGSQRDGLWAARPLGCPGAADSSPSSSSPSPQLLPSMRAAGYPGAGSASPLTVPQPGARAAPPAPPAALSYPRQQALPQTDANDARGAPGLPGAGRSSARWGSLVRQQQRQQQEQHRQQRQREQREKVLTKQQTASNAGGLMGQGGVSPGGDAAGAVSGGRDGSQQLTAEQRQRLERLLMSELLGGLPRAGPQGAASGV